MHIKRNLQALAAALAFGTTPLFATEATKTVPNSSIAIEANGGNREITKLANTIRIYVGGTGSWGLPYCSETRSHIRAIDTHLLSVLYSAWNTGRDVRITITGNLNLDDDDGACQITAISPL